MRRTVSLVAVTLALGVCFLLVKAAEYAHHFAEGIYPAGHGRFFDTHADAGTKMFFTLYFCMTGLHALHVFVGMIVLGVLLVAVARGRVVPRAPHALAAGAIYWHFVDLVWIFLWPLFYLVPGGSR